MKILQFILDDLKWHFKPFRRHKFLVVGFGLCFGLLSLLVAASQVKPPQILFDPAVAARGACALMDGCDLSAVFSVIETIDRNNWCYCSGPHSNQCIQDVGSCNYINYLEKYGHHSQEDKR